MAKRKSKETLTVCYTGLTEREWVDELRLTEEGKEVRNQCYLCHRREGEVSVAVHVGRDAATFPPLTLEPVERPFGDLTFAFHLCQECRILLGGFGKVGADAEESPVGRGNSR